MVRWNYLETYAKNDNGEIALYHKILSEYCEQYSYDKTKSYSLTQLGEDGWNLTYILGKNVKGYYRFIFRRPA